MRGFKLATIIGLEIRIDYSWFILFFLILWTFTFGVFPLQAPGLASGAYIAMGIIGTLLLFASLLAHEMAHSIVARAKGIPVEGITLFIFGGMAHTRMEAERPGDEFAIAGVGPLASVLIGGLFWLLALAGQQLGWSPAVVVVARYLAFINVVLAVFNLLPGFPLDGGRLFRALVWKATGSLHKATRWATNGGRFVGYFIMALGILSFFGGNIIGGLWFVFIGWFVRNAADASFTQHVLRESLAGVAARDVMTSDITSVPAAMSLQGFVEEFILRGRHTAYPVEQDGHPVGMITLANVKAVPREEWPHRRVADAMKAIPEQGFVSPKEPMSKVLERFGGADSGRLLVARDGELVGIITRADLARWLERAELLEEKR
jgi:Zn-dependent protease/CBS domain-containing protein